MIAFFLLVMVNRISAPGIGDQPVVRREYLQALIQFALIVVATVPVLVVYPFVQKYFVHGVMIGAIKGVTRRRDSTRKERIP